MKKIILLYAVLLVAFILLAVIGFGRDIPFVPDFGFGNNTTNPSASAKIGEQTINLLVADSDEERIKGLSGRNNLDDDQGMVFVFPEKNEYSFWMKGMHFPIDIIFINDTTVTDVYKNLAPTDDENSNPERYTASEPVNYVLELNAGKADALGIEKGTTITFEGL